MFRGVEGLSNPHHFTKEIPTSEDSSLLANEENRTSQVSFRSLRDSNLGSNPSSEIKKSDKTLSVKHLNIQSDDSIPPSPVLAQLRKIKKLTDNPQKHIRFHAQLQNEINKYESLLKKEKSPWPLVRYVALSILGLGGLGSSPVFKAKAINSKIDMSDENFKAVQTSLLNPGIGYEVKNLVCQLGKEKGIYTGKIVSGFMQDDEGLIKYSDRTYKGPILRDRLSGTGTMKYVNGDVYTGPFKDGKFDTESELGVKGELKKGGVVYKGRFLKDRFISGTIFDKDKVYIGGFDRDGKFNGTVSIGGRPPKMVKNSINVGIQDPFNYKKTQISKKFELQLKKLNENRDL